MSNKIFWFDIETNGLHYYLNEIISFAYLIEIDNKVVEDGIFHARPDNLQYSSYQSLQVNGFNPDQILSFDTQSALMKNINGVLEKYQDKDNRFVTAGYNNSGFDCIFLQQLFERHDDHYGYFRNFKNIKLDVFNLIPIISDLTGIDFNSHKLEDMAKLFGISHNAHDAMSDIIVTYKLYKIFLNKIKQGGK